MSTADSRLPRTGYNLDLKITSPSRRPGQAKNHHAASASASACVRRNQDHVRMARRARTRRDPPDSHPKRSRLRMCGVRTQQGHVHSESMHARRRSVVELASWWCRGRRAAEGPCPASAPFTGAQCFAPRVAGDMSIRVVLHLFFPVV